MAKSILPLASLALAGATLNAADSGPSLIDPEAWAASTDRRMYITLDDATFQGTPEDNKFMDVVLVVQRTDGQWLSGVAVMPQGLNQGSSSGRLEPAADGSLDFIVHANIGSDRWVPGDPSAQFSIDLTDGPNGITATYSGVFRGAEVSGEARVTEQARLDRR